MICLAISFITVVPIFGVFFFIIAFIIIFIGLRNPLYRYSRLTIAATKSLLLSKYFLISSPALLSLIQEEKINPTLGYAAIALGNFVAPIPTWAYVIIIVAFVIADVLLTVGTNIGMLKAQRTLRIGTAERFVLYGTGHAKRAEDNTEIMNIGLNFHIFVKNTGSDTSIISDIHAKLGWFIEGNTYSIVIDEEKIRFATSNVSAADRIQTSPGETVYIRVSFVTTSWLAIFIIKNNNLSKLFRFFMSGYIEFYSSEQREPIRLAFPLRVKALEQLEQK